MGIFDKFTKPSKAKEETELTTIGSGVAEENDLITISDAVLLDTRTDITSLNTISVPIGEMVALGSVVASLIPSLRTVTQTASVNSEGLFRIANAGLGDTLKAAKNGNFWGALKTAEGGSKLAQLTEVGSVSVTSQTVMPINPATMMMAVALFSIEQQLGKIEEMERQIVSFLHEEKESQIEGDLKTLTNILQEYKYNWEDEKYKVNHHKLALDIKRSAEQNIILYQKQVADVQKENHAVVGKTTIDSVSSSLQKKMKYYRLSLYIYSMASFLEMMLLGNFQGEYVMQIKNKIEKYSLEYRDTFNSCSEYLESIVKNSISKTALQGLGVVENALGNFINSIPLVKEGQVDEWLINNASQHKDAAQEIEKKIVEQFSAVSNPGTRVFIERLDEMNRIYNHTEQIFFDDKRIYLVAG